MADWKRRERDWTGSGAMSDEIIHLEEAIRERIRFGDARTT